MAWLLLPLVLFATIICGARGQISFVLNEFTQASFSANGGLSFNGDAAAADGTLTPDATGKLGSIYFNTPIPATDTSFTVSFHVQIDMSNCYTNQEACGDGLAFVIQNTAFGPSFLPAYMTGGYGYVGAEELPSGFIIAFEPDEDDLVFILPAGSPNEINQSPAWPNGPFEFASGPALYDYYINATYTDYNKNLLVTYVDNSVYFTPQQVYDGTFDLYGQNALGQSSQYYVGFSAGTDSDNAINEQYSEGHKLISVAFQACPATDTPCSIPTSPSLSPPATISVYSGLDTTLNGLGGVQVSTSVSDLRDCRIFIDDSHDLQTGFQALTTSSDNVCCSVRGLIVGSDCLYTTCSSSFTPTDFVHTLPSGLGTSNEFCLPSSSCYALDSSLTAATTYSTPLTGGSLTFDGASSLRNAYVLIGSALLPAYTVSSNGGVKRVGNDVDYACVYRGTYDTNSESCEYLVGCGSTPVSLTPYIIDTNNVDGVVDNKPAICYTKCASV